MPTPNYDSDENDTCHDPSSVWPVVIVAGSALLGYVVGRVSYSRNLRAALRRIEEATEPVEITIRTL